MPRLRLLAVYLGTSVVALGIVILVFDPEMLFGAVGRDASLTGRIPLWQTLWPFARQRLLLGWGYAGFFNADVKEMQYIWKIIEWKAPNAHNGYLDIMLQIGVIGLGLYLWVWSRAIVLSIKILRTPGGAKEFPVGIWAGLFMLVNVALNMDEGPLPYQDQFTMLMPLTILGLEEAWGQIRSRIRAGKVRRSLFPKQAPLAVAGAHGSDLA
jgi:O-antigen ligase